MVKSNKRRDEERRAAAAAKVIEMQQAQRSAERRRQSLIVSAVAVAVIVLVVGVTVIVLNHKSTATVSASGVGGSTASYGFVVGKGTAPASMVAYEDFQCPVCQAFEGTVGSIMQQYITDGKLMVEFRPIAILDRESSTNYSTRALNAAACVRNYSTEDDFKLFHDLLYKNQPKEASAGLTDAQLISYATQAGASKPAVGTCITDQKYKDWTVSATDASSKAGVNGTPTVKLNGKDVPLATLGDPTAFKKALDAAVADGSKTK